ncbi:unannotated protein [freshwater metagenome]|uniref:Unannotated protein n=1 Tax=freshwater metagenome TaxID=449393 RepID=A0A6J6JL94_9ZZZZ
MARGVSKNLYFDVPGSQDRLFNKHAPITKCCLSLSHSRLEGTPKRLWLIHTAHSTPATTGHRLCENRKTNLI